jgi:hypothetical protein
MRRATKPPTKSNESAEADMRDKNTNYNSITGWHITYRLVPVTSAEDELAQLEALDDVTDVSLAKQELDRIFGQAA